MRRVGETTERATSHEQMFMWLISERSGTDKRLWLWITFSVVVSNGIDPRAAIDQPTESHKRTILAPSWRTKLDATPPLLNKLLHRHRLDVRQVIQIILHDSPSLRNS